MKEIHFITSNKGKLEEAEKKLFRLGFHVVGSDIYVPEIQANSVREVIEYALDFLETNEEANRLGRVMLDDSGLFIDYLKGFPGVYSAYVLNTIGYKGILKLLEGVEEELREARFIACIGYLDMETKEREIFEGVSSGKIAFAPRGSGGFGYDPIFIPKEGNGRTFAEIPTEEKNIYSHRGRALDAMVRTLFLKK
jgi:XTP/dITP diphosphohydrolase